MPEARGRSHTSTSPSASRTSLLWSAGSVSEQIGTARQNVEHEMAMADPVVAGRHRDGNYARMTRVSEWAQEGRCRTPLVETSEHANIKNLSIRLEAFNVGTIPLMDAE